MKAVAMKGEKSFRFLFCLTLAFGILFPHADSRIFPAGAGYVGAGYNLLLGNPDGAHFASGGPDSGLLPTKFILEKTIPETDYCPDQSICTQVATDLTDDQDALITDLQQYQKLVSTSWDFDTEQPLLPLETSYAGTKSPSIKEAQQLVENEKYVILDRRKITTVTELRINYRENRRLTTEFLMDLCRLPEEYKTEDYKRFLTTWGTHVITAIKAGQVAIIRYEIPFGLLNSFILKYPSLSKILKLNAATSTLSYNSLDFQEPSIVQTFIDLMSRGNFSAGEYTVRRHEYASGSAGNPTPIHLTLRRLDYFITSDFAEISDTDRDFNCDNFTDEFFAVIQGNIRKALYDYPVLSEAPMLFPFVRTFPLNWPRGTYAMVKNQNCPESGPSHVWYGPGTVTLSDKLEYFMESLPTTEFDVELSPFRRNAAELSLKFCVKLAESSAGAFDWPMGSYCIFRKKDCPTGFTGGTVSTGPGKAIRGRRNFNGRRNHVHRGKNCDHPSHFTDLDSDALPDGSYSGKISSLDFCCRNDRAIDEPMFLPSTQPFSLLSTGGSCQRVQGMESGLRIQTLRSGVLSGNHPFVTSNDDIIRLHFCYYKPWTVNPV